MLGTPQGNFCRHFKVGFSEKVLLYLSPSVGGTRVAEFIATLSCRRELARVSSTRLRAALSVGEGPFQSASP